MVSSPFIERVRLINLALRFCGGISDFSPSEFVIPLRERFLPTRFSVGSPALSGVTGEFGILKKNIRASETAVSKIYVIFDIFGCFDNMYYQNGV